MTDEKKRKVTSGVGLGAAIGVALDAAYCASSGYMSRSVTLGIAFGVALGAAFDFVSYRKKKSES